MAALTVEFPQTVWTVEFGGDEIVVAPVTMAPGAPGGGGGGGAVDSVNGQTGTVVLDAGDVGAVPVSRTITAGAGLVGGGDLSADRTLAQAAAGPAVAVSAVDGTATMFHVIVPSPGAAAAAPIPAGWVDGGAGLLPVSFLPAGAVVVRPGDSALGESFGLYRIPAGGASSGPWESLPLSIGQVIGVGTFGSTVIAGTYTGAGVEAIGPDARINSVDARIDGVDTRIDGVESTGGSYTGTGLLGGISTGHSALNQLEGILDRWLFPTAVSLTNFDLSTLSPPTQPTLSGGSVPSINAYVWLLDQTNPTENGAYFVDGSGVWTKTVNPDVFDPPGNGYRITLRSPGSDLDGVTWTWIGDSGHDDKRGGDHQETSPSTTGRWVRVDPVADPLALTARNVDATDITSGTVATARLGSGTADSTTFLRGDQTWATPSGASSPSSDWHTISDTVLASAGSLTVPDLTGLTDVEFTVTGRSNASTAGWTYDGVRMRFNGDGGSNYSIQGGAATSAFNNNGTLPGSDTNTNRQGLWVARFALGGSGKMTVGWWENTYMLSTGTTVVIKNEGSLAYMATSAAITSAAIYLSSGSSFAAGTRFTVRGRTAP